MDDAIAQHDILDKAVSSSSNRLNYFIRKRIAVASSFAALRGCVPIRLCLGYTFLDAAFEGLLRYSHARSTSG